MSSSPLGMNAPGGPSPLVGRGAELGRLLDALSRAAQGSGHCVFVLGEPGIGKTRLALELLSRAERTGARVAVGHWYDNEPGPPYSGFAECLQQLAGDIEALKSALGAYADELLSLLPDIGLQATRQLGLRPGEEVQFRLFEAVARFIVDVSSTAPLVLLLEDLHWADAASTLLLRYVARRTAQSATLIVCTCRDTELDVDHPMLETVSELRRERLYADTVLKGLDREAVGELVSAMTGFDVAPEFAQAIHHQTEGNPFFIEEFILDLMGGGKLSSASASEGRLLMPADLAIPEGVKQAIRSRLWRLGDGCYGILQVASVLGRDFDFYLLELLSEAEHAVVTHALEAALQARLITETSIGRYPACRFTHVLIRETLYHDISAPRRTELHARAAEKLEEYYGSGADKHCAEIAHHLTQAGSGADPAKGFHYSWAAGKLARSVSDLAPAQHYLSNALAFLERLERPPRPEELEVLVDLGWVLSELMRPDDGIKLIREAINEYDRQDLADCASRARLCLAGILNACARFPESIQELDKVLEQTAGQATFEHYYGCGLYAIALMGSGRLGQAGPFVQDSLELPRRLGDEYGEALALYGAGLWHALDFGDPEEAPLAFRESREKLLRYDALNTAALVAVSEAICLYLLGRISDAEKTAEEAMQLALRYGPRMVADVHALRTLMALHRGDWPAAEAEKAAHLSCLEKAESLAFGQLVDRADCLRELWLGSPEGALATAQRVGSPLVLPIQGLAKLELGDREGALTMFSALSQWLPKDGHGGIWLLFALPLASAYCSLGLAEEAAAWYQSISRHRGWLPDCLLPEIELGRIATLNEWWKRAEEHFVQAERFCAEHNLRPFLAQAYYQHGLMAIRRGERRVARQCLQRAAALFEELGMARYLIMVKDAWSAVALGRPPTAHYPFGLTPRELEVLQLAAAGQTNVKIAAALQISPKTVERHISNILVKTDAADRAQAAVLAAQAGLIDPLA